MEIKTSELTGAALDWAVAKCRGFEGLDEDQWLLRDGIADMPLSAYNPSTDWGQGGPIIEREGIAIDCIRWSGEVDGWIATLPMFCDAKYEEPSPTPLIAAMRCFVSSRLGDAVEVPEAL